MDPWDKIETPSSAEGVNARRVSASLKWPWYRGRDRRGRPVLLLRLAIDPGSTRFPAVRGVEIRTTTRDAGVHFIVLTLTDSDAKEPFQHVCDDLVDFCEHVQEEQNLARRIGERLDVWRRLLGREHTGLLTDEQQRGLIAELYFMRDIWLPAIGEPEAVDGWEGPTESSQDFRHGFTAVEVKSRRPASSSVFVSSADQLWFDGHLFMVAYPLATVGQVDGDAVSLFEAVA